MIELGTIPKDAFKAFFGFSSSIYKGVELHLETDNMWLCCVDTSNTLMIHNTLHINLPHQALVCIDIDEIAALSPKQDVKFFYEQDYLSFTIDAELEYKQRMMSDPKIKTSPFPKEMKLPVTLTIPPDKVGMILELANNLLKKKESAEKMIFNVQDGVFTVQNIEGTRKFTPTDVIIEGASARSVFSPDLIQDITSHYKLYDTITMQLGIDNPIVITYTNEHVTTMTLAAPRILHDE